MHDELKKAVCEANIELQKQKLVIYSWGNVSGIDREAGVVAIKPSGVPYDELEPEKMVLLDLDGNIVGGDLKPSTDAPSHLELYRNFESIGGVCHTHSTSATMWAQACREIPCFGTTHADYFHDAVPVTKTMTSQQVKSDYERNTGKVIVERFAGLDPMEIPGVLVAHHGPFTWGKGPGKAVEVAVVLEQIAMMAFGTISLNPGQCEIPLYLLDKHYYRKYGKDAYYGQKDK